jgi:hypothetical protein
LLAIETNKNQSKEKQKLFGRKGEAPKIEEEGDIIGLSVGRIRKPSGVQTARSNNFFKG